MMLNGWEDGSAHVGWLEKLTVAQAGRRCRGFVSSEAPSLSLNRKPILGRFLLAWAGCEPPAAWAHGDILIKTRAGSWTEVISAFIIIKRKA